MIAFPHLFQRAGIIPVTASIIFVFITSTLGGTLLADAISKLPGNRRFSKNVSYSHAFRIVMGDEAYILAESLFLISCGVQAVAAIVAVAQSIDSLLSSVIIGHTYALQVLPSIQLINWSPALCHAHNIAKCIPFNSDSSIYAVYELSQKVQASGCESWTDKISSRDPSVALLGCQDSRVARQVISRDSYWLHMD